MLHMQHEFVQTLTRVHGRGRGEVSKWPAQLPALQPPLAPLRFDSTWLMQIPVRQEHAAKTVRAPQKSSRRTLILKYCSAKPPGLN
jgi:hypothetical protein